MAFGIKKYVDIVNDMIAFIIANQDKITDFNEGSVMRSFVESVATEIEQEYIKVRVGFSRELVDVPFYAFNFSKQAGQQSVGSVIFSRSGTSGTATIPIGTIIATFDGIQFATTVAASITPGNTNSASTTIQALLTGTGSNVPATTIDSIVSPLTGVESVSNAASTTGGLNAETDVEYLKRFQDFIEGLGLSNITGLKTGAKSVTGVRSASVVEHFPPSSSYNLTVYIDDGAGNASAALIASVLAVLTGDGTVANPGYKGAGVNMQVVAPSKVAVSINVTITSDGSISNDSITYLAKQVLSNYINNLGIGDDVIRNKIIEVLMEVPGIADLTLTTPASNTAISTSQIARLADSDITITYA